MSDEITIIHGDCREILPTLAFDAIVSDPPYGIAFQKGEGGRGTRGSKSVPRRNLDSILGDDEPFDPSHLLAWPCVLFGADHFRARLPETGSFHAWDKKAYSTLDDSFSDVEFIWSSQGGKSRIISHLWKGVQQASEKNAPKYHVSQKPVRVMVQLIEWFTKPGDVICDPYAGSGSTGIACLKTGRRCILIENDPKYLPIIRHRVEAARTPLFAG
jgi:site-specific DNA-methyltransferase (adenine-specific)